MFNNHTVIVLEEKQEIRVIAGCFMGQYFTVPKTCSIFATKFTSVFELSEYLTKMFDIQPELRCRVKLINYKKLKEEA